MEYVVRFTEQDFQILSAALGELPFKLAAPLVERINAQVRAQASKEAKPAPEAPPEA